MPAATESGSGGALRGVRVIDMAAVVMGPYAAQILGDLGADVVKAEPPAGDVTRRTRPQRHEGMGALALNVNRNKRSLALDLKAAEGHEAFLELVRRSDVLITNTRPAALRRLGVDHETLAEVNPRLVYCGAQVSSTTATSTNWSSGGFRHFMARLGPGTARRWKNMGEPELAPEVAERLIRLTERELSGMDDEELARIRDRQEFAVLAAREHTRAGVLGNSARQGGNR